MRILNIHGYCGTPRNAAYAALCENGCTEITAPALDYDAVPPDRMAERLRAFLSESRAELIVGTSLGGFYAAVLAAETGLPVFLVNPCLMPFLHLPRLGYSGDIRAYLPLFAELERLDSARVYCIVGDADEVIDTHDFAEHLFGNARLRVAEGGHHSGATLPLKEYFGEMLSGLNQTKGSTA